MSWLSPRRRRTTGNLKNVPNGQYRLMLDNAEGLIIPTRLESTGENPLSIVRRLSPSHGQGSQHSSDDKENALQTGERGRADGESFKDVQEQEQETNRSKRDGQSNGQTVNNGLEEQLRHIADLLKTLSTRLEQIQQTIWEGNTNTSPLQKHLEGLDSAARANVEGLQQLLESQQFTRQAIAQSSRQIDMQPLIKPLASLQDSASAQTKHLQDLIEAQNATREAVEANSGEIDVSPLVDQMEAVSDAIEEQRNPLLGHLEAIRSATERNAEQIASLVEAQSKLAESAAKSIDLNLTPMTERLNKVHASLERACTQDGDKTPGAGDPKFILSALTSHLSKIQGITEQNAKSIQSVQSKHSSIHDTQATMQTSITSTSDFIRSLATANVETHRLLAKRSNDVEDKSKEDIKSIEKRIDATNGQVRELMTGQREMTKVMRDLANAISAQNKGNCDHVVIPPPRKLAKKVVGFVYDGKVVESPEGGILRQ